MVKNSLLLNMLNNEIYKAVIWHEKKKFIIKFQFTKRITKVSAIMLSGSQFSSIS